MPTLSSVSARLFPASTRAEAMTINDLCCDVCGSFLAGLSGWPGPHGQPDASSAGQPDASSAGQPDASSAGQPGPAARAGRPGLAGGVRFVYHPGAPQFRDDSGLACEPCWADAVGGFGDSVASRCCAACGEPVTRTQSLHLRRFDDPRSWRLCASDAVDFLNRLRTVQPKLDPAVFRFPAAGRTAAGSPEGPSP
jgi:hypothetical protein